MTTVFCETHEETLRLGEQLGLCAAAGVVVALRGELGAGKTVFAKGVGIGLGVKTIVTSPTFVLMQLYEEGRIPFLHADLYRLSGYDEAIEMGMEDFMSTSVSLLEWSERCPELLPDDHLVIDIRFRESGRDIQITSTGPQHQKTMAAWLE